jgi:hypothetical protein
MIPIHKYLHEHDFESSAFLRENKSHLIKMHEKHISNLKDGTNDMSLIGTPLNKYFNQKVKNLIEEYYIVEKSSYNAIFNVYIQTPKFSANHYHNHIHTPQTICGVMYLDVPQEGGEIEFIHYPNFTPDNPIKIKPQEDKLYLFPSWLYHRPLPSSSSTPRICINIGYITSSRPITKNYGFIW